MILLEQARTIVSASLALARAQNFRPLTVVVLDVGGHPIALEREDGASFGRPAIAIGKAAGALAMGTSSRALGDMAVERPQFIGALAVAWDGRMIPAAGGVLVRDGEGRVIGAVGISGDTSDKDEEAAIAGITAAGLVAG
ncbi:MAG: heme-binding protein [Novosphingobium sp.]|nr:heme-binding protein [Novosphingobium sp.]